MIQDNSIKKFIPLIRTILIMGACTLIIQFIANYISKNEIITDFHDLRLISVVIFAFLLEGFRVILGLILYRYVDKRKWSNFGFKIKKKDMIVTLIGVLSMVISFGLFIFITGKLNIAMWSFKYIEYIVPIYFIQAILVRGLFVGMGEEFLYRGYLFKSLSSYNKVIQYGVNMLVFVSIHFIMVEFSVLYFIELVTATFLFVYIYDKTGSIWPGVIIHGVMDLLGTLVCWNFNGISVVYFWWYGDYSFYDAIDFLYVIMNIILIILVWLFYGRKSRKINKVIAV